MGKDPGQEMFLQLVMQFQSAALIQLGQVKNPQTNKFERNLKQAQYFINMLDMLEKKTAGNLTTEETKMLKDALSSLKMTYVNLKQNNGPESNSNGNDKAE